MQRFRSALVAEEIYSGLASHFLNARSRIALVSEEINSGLAANFLKIRQRNKKRSLPRKFAEKLAKTYKKSGKEFVAEELAEREK